MRFRLGASVFVAGTVALTGIALAEGPACNNPDALGVSRTVQINTKGGPGFGLEHYKAYDFLQPKEVVLTFDDGPQKFSTEAVLEALGKECVKATFFSVGKMALGYPEIIREVAHQGHTVGSHTWSHQAIPKLKTFEAGRDEIERGVSAVQRAVGTPTAPFFRFPTLRDSEEAVAYLGKRNIAMFSTDIDSFDFKRQAPKRLVAGVMKKLEKKGKGIILMHDIHMNTAKTVPLLLAELKAGGYKIVHLTAKAPVTTLAEFDKAIEKDAKGLPVAGSERPLSSVVETVSGDAPAAEVEERAAAQPHETGSTSSSGGAPAGKAETAPDAPPAAAPAAPVKPEASIAPAAPAEEHAQANTAAEPDQASAQVIATVPANHTATGLATSSIHSEDGGVVTDAAEAGSQEPTAHKSWSEQAKDAWETWFGK